MRSSYREKTFHLDELLKHDKKQLEKLLCELFAENYAAYGLDSKEFGLLITNITLVVAQKN